VANLLRRSITPLGSGCSTLSVPVGCYEQVTYIPLFPGFLFLCWLTLPGPSASGYLMALYKSVITYYSRSPLWNYCHLLYLYTSKWMVCLLCHIEAKRCRLGLAVRNWWYRLRICHCNISGELWLLNVNVIFLTVSNKDVYLIFSLNLLKFS